MSNDITGNEPMQAISDEIDAIHEAVEGTDLWVLVYWGSQPRLFLVRRDRAPATEYPSQGERVAMIDWYGGEGYFIFAGEGDRTSEDHLKTGEDPIETVGTRGEAIKAAGKIIDEDDT